jgi:hypothetical protein
VTYHKEKQKEGLRRQPLQNETSESSGDEKHRKWRKDARSIIAQARVNKARHAWKEVNYEDNEKEMGALCFTCRVRRMRVPRGFKLPHDQEKYDGSQEPTLWLSDYLQVVKNTQRNKSNGNAKFAVTPHWRSTVLVEYSTQQFHQKLGRTREPIRKKFSLNVQTTNIIGRS